MTRFLPRATPLVGTIRAVEDIFAWKDPTRTMLVLIGCRKFEKRSWDVEQGSCNGDLALLCGEESLERAKMMLIRTSAKYTVTVDDDLETKPTLFISLGAYPIILALLPSAFLLYIITYHYYQKVKADIASNRNRSMPPVQQIPSASSATLSSYSASNPTPGLVKQPPSTEHPSYYLKDPSTTLTRAHVQRTMQFMQTQTVMFNTAYEGVVELTDQVNLLLPKILPYLSWETQPHRPFLILLFCITSAVSTLIMVEGVQVPWRAVFALSGLFAFLGSTQAAKVVFHFLFPALVDRLASELSHWNQSLQFHVASKKPPSSSPSSSTRTINPLPTTAIQKESNETSFTLHLIEHQRYYPLLGFIPHLKLTDPDPWTDPQGNSRPMKDIYALPDPTPLGSWVWESEWEVDPGVFGVAVGLDGGGWVYSDTKWEGKEKEGSWGIVTRRRAWKRRVGWRGSVLGESVTKVFGGLVSKT
ncbi:peroxisome- protein [Chytridiales sp. JEL 0842]|nr:peroxisome- protein [Chytridiales sp. JEL 0842]